MATSIFNPKLSEEGEIDARYEHVQGEYRFGVPSSATGNIGFSVPVISFKFRSPFGVDLEASGAPKIFIRAPNGLNLSQLSNYQASGPVFGGGGSISADSESAESANNIFGTTFSSFAQGLATQLNEATTKLQGYLQSAGQSGRDQAEFSTRSTINPFQQLLYKGPNFKQYSLPFTFRPKNINEARSMMSIISAFKIASSPKIQKGTYTDIDVGQSLFSGSIDAAFSAIAGEVALSFGYPDLVEFEIQMFTNGITSNASNTEVATLYQSLPCAIQSVSTDYGQQKMSFFIPEEGSNEYYPTEVTMTLSLQEVAYRSLSEAIRESDPSLKRGIR